MTVLLPKSQHQSSKQWASVSWCFLGSYLYSGISGSLPSVLRVKQHCCSWDFGSFQSWFKMNSWNTQTIHRTHVIKQLLSQSAFKESETNKNQRQLQTPSSSITHAFISFLSWRNLFALSDWLSICVFTVSTNHRLLKTKANPWPEIKSAWESPRCAALIHFSYPRGTSKSPSINREAALS